MNKIDEKIINFVNEQKDFLAANNIDVSHSMITGEWFVYRTQPEYGYYDYYIKFKI